MPQSPKMGKRERKARQAWCVAVPLNTPLPKVTVLADWVVCDPITSVTNTMTDWVVCECITPDSDWVDCSISDVLN